MKRYDEVKKPENDVMIARHDALFHFWMLEPGIHPINYKFPHFIAIPFTDSKNITQKRFLELMWDMNYA